MIGLAAKATKKTNDFLYPLCSIGLKGATEYARCKNTVEVMSINLQGNSKIHKYEGWIPQEYRAYIVKLI